MIQKFLKERQDELALVSLSVVVLMSKAYESTLQAMDSSIHARLALEVSKGGWVPKLPMPNLHEKGGEFFNDHPFTLFFIVGKFMRIVGAEAWSARFIPSLFGVLCVLLVKKIGDEFFSKRVGFFSALLLLFTPLFIQFTARFQLDPAMIFFITFSFYLWLKNKSVAAGLSVGAAVAFKSPVGFLLFPSILLAHTLERRWSRKRFKPLLVAGLASLIFPLLIWWIADRISGQPLMNDYLSRQVFGTAVEGRHQGVAFDPLYFLHEVLRRNLPWKLWLLLAAFCLFKFPRKIPLPRPHFSLIASGAVVLIVVISAMRFKFPHYYLPAFPLLAILFAAMIDPLFQKIESGARSVVLVLAYIAPLVLLILPIHTAPEMFPALRKFATFIQSAGTAKDRVLFVENAEPYGTAGDYFVETIFYTGRRYLETQCANANPLIEKEKPEWIITSGARLQDCVSDRNLTRYPFRIQLGNQFLLGQKNVTGSATDLTPLYRELKVPVDGEPAPLPKDIQYRY